MNTNKIYSVVAIFAIANAAGFYYINQKFEKMYQQIPQIAIVDLVKIAKQYPEGASETEVNTLMVKTNNAILKLKEAGYLVIDSQAVLAAPEELKVDKELFE